ncbi:hypothetical protein [Mycobacterium paraseoulense]|nr:hypothetical protein [Mycobacterium paraseoulense]MCV7394540.1 hypothetical protein [Mycobacterium paraseoulense]
MRITAMAAAGLTVAMIVTACPAHADATAPAAFGHGYRLEPPPAPDPEAEVAELQRQVNELHDNWDNLTPAQRQQRLTQLQQQATTVSNDAQNLPPAQRPGVELRLLQTMAALFDLVRKAQGPNQPCYFPACLPGL